MVDKAIDIGEGIMKKQSYRAVGTGLVVFLEALAVYQTFPTTLDAFWQPGLQALLAGLSVLGINMATRTRSPR